MLHVQDYAIKHVITNVVNHAQLRVGIDVAMHVQQVVVIHVLDVVHGATHHAKQNVKIQQDIHV